jgi:precorrin-6A/cobalt-precorrin-6A reductase
VNQVRPAPCVLVLGGTTEARELAAALVEAGVPAISSLAGRLERPQLPVGAIRVGGFGGPHALADWLREHQIAAVVDATHPFAAQVSASAAEACAATHTPLIRLDRPAWTAQPGDRWHRVTDLAEAAEVVPRLGRRVLLTIGRRGVAAFANITAAWFVIRCIEQPADPLPPNHELILARGPFTLASELALIDQHAIDLLVTRDSGGAATEAKLEAARQRQLPVIVVRRPAPPAGATVPDVSGAVAWVQSIVHPGSPASRSR